VSSVSPPGSARLGIQLQRLCRRASFRDDHPYRRRAWNGLSRFIDLNSTAGLRIQRASDEIHPAAGATHGILFHRKVR
jgi:hypothetical protein